MSGKKRKVVKKVFRKYAAPIIVSTTVLIKNPREGLALNDSPHLMPNSSYEMELQHCENQKLAAELYGKEFYNLYYDSSDNLKQTNFALGECAKDLGMCQKMIKTSRIGNTNTTLILGTSSGLLFKNSLEHYKNKEYFQAAVSSIVACALALETYYSYNVSLMLP